MAVKNFLRGRRNFEFYEGFGKFASIRHATDAFFKKVKVEPEMSLESNDTYFVKLMIEHGLGVSLMSSWTSRQEIESGKLAQIKIAGHELNRSVAMVSLKNTKSAPIRAFIAYILEQKARLQKMAVGEKSLFVRITFQIETNQYQPFPRR